MICRSEISTRRSIASSISIPFLNPHEMKINLRTFNYQKELGTVCLVLWLKRGRASFISLSINGWSRWVPAQLSCSTTQSTDLRDFCQKPLLKGHLTAEQVDKPRVIILLFLVLRNQGWRKYKVGKRVLLLSLLFFWVPVGYPPNQPPPTP